MHMDQKLYSKLSKKKDEYLSTLDNKTRDRHSGQTDQDEARTQICRFLVWLDDGNWGHES